MHTALFWAMAAVTLLVSSCNQPAANDQQVAVPPKPDLQVIEAPSGSNHTILSPSIILNDESTLQRTTYVIQDPSAPILLKTGLMGTGYKRESYTSYYVLVGAAEGEWKQPVTATEIFFLATDVWGDRLDNYKLSMVKDMEIGPMRISGGWRLHSEHDASRFLNGFIFVSRARLADGTIWQADVETIAERIGQYAPKVTQADLSTDEDKSESAEDKQVKPDATP